MQSSRARLIPPARRRTAAHTQTPLPACLTPTGQHSQCSPTRMVPLWAISRQRCFEARLVFAFRLVTSVGSTHARDDTGETNLTESSIPPTGSAASSGTEGTLLVLFCASTLLSALALAVACIALIRTFDPEPVRYSAGPDNIVLLDSTKPSESLSHLTSQPHRSRSTKLPSQHEKAGSGSLGHHLGSPSVSTMTDSQEFARLVNGVARDAELHRLHQARTARERGVGPAVVKVRLEARNLLEATTSHAVTAAPPLLGSEVDSSESDRSGPPCAAAAAPSAVSLAAFQHGDLVPALGSIPSSDESSPHGDPLQSTNPPNPPNPPIAAAQSSVALPAAAALPKAAIPHSASIAAVFSIQQHSTEPFASVPRAIAPVVPATSLPSTLPPATASPSTSTATPSAADLISPHISHETRSAPTHPLSASAVDVPFSSPYLSAARAPSSASVSQSIPSLNAATTPHPAAAATATASPAAAIAALVAAARSRHSAQAAPKSAATLAATPHAKTPSCVGASVNTASTAGASSGLQSRVSYVANEDQFGTDMHAITDRSMHASGSGAWEDVPNEAQQQISSCGAGSSVNLFDGGHRSRKERASGEGDSSTYALFDETEEVERDSVERRHCARGVVERLLAAASGYSALADGQAPAADSPSSHTHPPPPDEAIRLGSSQLPPFASPRPFSEESEKEQSVCAAQAAAAQSLVDNATARGLLLRLHQHSTSSPSRRDHSVPTTGGVEAAVSSPSNVASSPASKAEIARKLFSLMRSQQLQQEKEAQQEQERLQQQMQLPQQQVAKQQ